MNAPRDNGVARGVRLFPVFAPRPALLEFNPVHRVNFRENMSRAE